MISIIPTKAVVAPAVTKPFEVIGGTPPYLFSIVPGGIGGTIDTNGLYTAPLGVYGVDTILATDSFGAIDTQTVSVLNTMEMICDIIQTEMGLADGRVYLYNQKIPEPTDTGLFIVVEQISCKPFGNTRSLDGGGAGLDSIQSANFSAMLQIDIISRDISALNRKEEVLMALKSAYAQQQQELNTFYIAPLPMGFVNLSHVDGSAIPYRFNVTINIQYCVTKVKPLDFYSDFSQPNTITNP